MSAPTMSPDDVLALVRAELDTLRASLTGAAADAARYQQLAALVAPADPPPVAYRHPPRLPDRPPAAWTDFLIATFAETVVPCYLAEPVALIWRPDLTALHGCAYTDATGQRAIECRPTGAGLSARDVVRTLFHELGHHACGHCEARLPYAAGQADQHAHARAAADRADHEPAAFATLYHMAHTRREAVAWQWAHRELDAWSVP